MKINKYSPIVIILVCVLLAACSSANEPTGEFIDQNETLAQLEHELQEAEAVNQKLKDQLEAEAKAEDEIFESSDKFFEALDSASGSVYDLTDFYADHLTDLSAGSAYGEAFGSEMLDKFYQTDIDIFLKATRRIPPVYMDAFAGHLVTALHMAYQYEEITTYQYNFFIESFQEIANNGYTSNEYRQLGFCVMANLFRDGDDPTAEGLFMPKTYQENIRIGNTTIVYYTGGGTDLEDGIFYVMEGYIDNKLEWMKLWEGIDVSELSVISPITYAGAYEDNQIYQVIDGDLYVIDVTNGEVLMKIENVGHSHAAPLVFANGDVVTIGQYSPYVTYINAEGEILWHKTYSLTFSGTWDVSASEKTITVESDYGKVVMDRDGNIIIDEASVTQMYQDAFELYGWFDIGSMSLDMNDSFQQGERTYHKVTKPYIFYDDLVEDLNALFDQATVENLLNRGQYLEKDGYLYGAMGDRGTDITMGEESYDFISDSEDRSTYKVTVEILDENGNFASYETYDFTLKRYEDGQWRFVDFYMFR